MQNTIVKEFAAHPGVVALIFDQGGQNGETREWLETFWGNYYLRGGVLFDETGETGRMYGQPSTGLPFGRGFIIDVDGRVALPYFGHQPQAAIAKIRELLGTSGDDAGPGTSAAAHHPLALLLRASSPFTRDLSVSFSLPLAGAVELDVYGPRGEHVRRLGAAWLPHGPHTIAWDAKTAAGREAAAGVYLLRLSGGGVRETAKCVRVGR